MGDQGLAGELGRDGRENVGRMVHRKGDPLDWYLRASTTPIFPVQVTFSSFKSVNDCRRHEIPGLAQSSVSRLDVVVSKLGEIMKSTHDGLDPVPLPYVSGLNGTNASQQTHPSA